MSLARKKIKIHRTSMVKKVTKCPFGRPRLLRAQ